MKKPRFYWTVEKFNKAGCVTCIDSGKKRGSLTGAGHVRRDQDDENSVGEIFCQPHAIKEGSPFRVRLL